ncbi:YdcF family protein, partial [Listeria monocytogenes]|nr:YdcF family protein [Listeria monocytogenes]
MRSLRKIVIILIIIGFMYLLIVAAFMFSGSRTKPSENA